MAMNWVDLVLFAQEAAPAAADPAAQGAAQQPPISTMLFPIVMMLVLFYFLIVSPERKKSKEKQALIDSLKKNDRVLTIGGIYGVVANVKPGEDEIIIKVDDDKDVKIRVTKSSIAQ